MCFLTPQLREILTKWGYDYEAAVAGWLERGWLLTNSGRKDYRFNLEKRRPAGIAIKAEILSEKDCIATPDTNEEEDYPADWDTP